MNRLHCTRAAGSDDGVLLLDDEPEIRVEKILDIRRQLGEGRYSITDRLDVVVDRMIEVLR